MFPLLRKDLHSNATAEELLSRFRARVREAPRNAFVYSTIGKDKNGNERLEGSYFGHVRSRDVEFAYVLPEDGVSTSMQVELVPNNLGGTILRCRQKGKWQAVFVVVSSCIAIFICVSMIFVFEPNPLSATAVRAFLETAFVGLIIPLGLLFIWIQYKQEANKLLWLVERVLADVKN